ncbi:MAG TPA: pyruvate dehydrogenase (acetyl-transferring) E1 component subunit alpha, partial [Alphaproteobacteria bacterium]|nr:pyruvate dehydrogenase (acetyl-transferring) E1 component subunit alpha [Alphaproteobacteria bacterium]
MAKAAAKGKNGSTAPGHNAAPTGEELLRYYREMLLIRRFEERAGQL